ncbi:MAG: formate dehydrogenase subunit delta [Chakrabartia sp.]
MNTVERLVYMANQIATNLATDENPVGAIAEHIQLFWDPRMKRLIFENGIAGLSPTAAAAITQLVETNGSR